MERVWLHLAEQRVTRLRRWRTGLAGGWSERFVTVGRLGDRWFADHTGLQGAFVADTEQEVQDLVAGWLAQGGWEETPAAFGPDGRPVEPGWVRRGGSWVRE